MPVCPSEEILLALLLGTLEEREASVVESHADSCDRCLQDLVALQANLGGDGAETTARPAEPRLAAVASVAAMRARRRWTWAVPLAVAAGSLLTLAVVREVPPTGPERQLRSVEEPRAWRVVAPVPLREIPSPHGVSQRTLARGEEVTVLAEERGWFQVERSNGERGWVEAEAFGW